MGFITLEKLFGFVFVFFWPGVGGGNISDGLQCLTFYCSRGVVLSLHSVHVFLGIAVLIQSLLFHTKLLSRELAVPADSKNKQNLKILSSVFLHEACITSGLNFQYIVRSVSC